LPEALTLALHQWQQENRWQLQYISQYHLRPLDLNNDGQQDYVLLTYSHHSVSAVLFSLKEGEWQSTAMTSSIKAEPEKTQPEPQLEALELKTIPPQWPLLQVGDRTFQVIQN
jgi:hypothetical protein